MPVILPNTYIAKFDPEMPLFFLAGPVRGGGDWQSVAHGLLTEAVGDKCCSVIPVRYRTEEKYQGHPLLAEALIGDEDYFRNQTMMERYYLKLAGHPGRVKNGCIIFWLGVESEVDPHPGPEPYAMDTRGELGRWSVIKGFQPGVRMVVGADPRFYGLRTIHRNIEADLGVPFTIQSRLQQTVNAAVAVAFGT